MVWLSLTTLPPIVSKLGQDTFLAGRVEHITVGAGESVLLAHWTVESK